MEIVFNGYGYIGRKITFGGHARNRRMRIILEWPLKKTNDRPACPNASSSGRSQKMHIAGKEKFISGMKTVVHENRPEIALGRHSTR